MSTTPTAESFRSFDETEKLEHAGCETDDPQIAYLETETIGDFRAILDGTRLELHHTNTEGSITKAYACEYPTSVVAETVGRALLGILHRGLYGTDSWVRKQIASHGLEEIGTL